MPSVSGKTGIVEYGWKPVLTPGESQAVQQSEAPSVGPTLSAGRRIVNWNETANVILVAAFTATTAAVLVCDPCLPVVLPEGFVFDESLMAEPEQQIASQRRSHVPVAAKREAVRPASAILEMNPAHKSLRDLPREKMSEFDRNYPW